MAQSGGSLLRERRPHGQNRVTSVELFFDLVFVFAITQISHFLLANFSPLGGLEAAILMLAVWWVWVFTAWITNWLDPDQTAVRLMLFALMIAGLLLSTSIPQAFAGRGLAFAAAYAAMQVGRSAFFLVSVPNSEIGHRRNFIRILSWLSASAVFWIAGGFTSGGVRIGLWLVALLIEYAGPAMRFWIPRFGASSTADWVVEGGHMAERAAGFIIIALGESIVVTGATFADTRWTPGSVAAMLVALVGAIAMWWIYFHIGAEAGSRHIAKSEDSGRIARLAYTYLHLPIVAGIVVSAVGNELLLAHPAGHCGIREILGIIGGPLLYLAGVILFKHGIRGHLQPSHLAGIGVLVILAPLALLLTPLLLSAATTAVLLGVAIWEAISLAPQQPHSEAASS